MDVPKNISIKKPIVIKLHNTFEYTTYTADLSIVEAEPDNVVGVR